MQYVDISYDTMIRYNTVRYMVVMCCNEWCSFQGLECMRSIASGVSAGGSLALAHHLLSLFEAPRPDLLTACNLAGGSDSRWDPASFLVGLTVGAALVLLIQAFYTLRWAFITFVQLHCCEAESGSEKPRKRQLYKLL